MWIYKSPVGLMRIIKDKESFALFIDEECYGKYHFPSAAADDVYLQHTSHSQWDNLEDVPDVPTDISEWVELPDPR